MNKLKVLVALLILAAGCSESENGIKPADDGKIKVRFNVEKPQGTRTYLNDDGSISWNEGDTISILDGEGNVVVELGPDDISEDGYTASFEALVAPADKYYAVYPGCECTLTADGTVKIPASAAGTVKCGDFGECHIAAACDNGSRNFLFHNITSILIFRTESSTDDWMTFKGNSGEMLCGTTEVSFDDAGATAKLTEPEYDEVSASFEMDFDKFEVSCQMGVLPGTFKKGFTIFTYNAASSLASIITTDKPLDIPAGAIIDFGDLQQHAIKALSFTKFQKLDDSDTQYAIHGTIDSIESQEERRFVLKSGSKSILIDGIAGTTAGVELPQLSVNDTLSVYGCKSTLDGKAVMKNATCAQYARYRISEAFLGESRYGIYDRQGADFIPRVACDGHQYQISSIQKDGKATFRMFVPGKNAFIEFSGLPETPSEGEEITFGLRGNMLAQTQETISAKVAKVEGNNVYLVSDSVGYVVSIGSSELPEPDGWTEASLPELVSSAPVEGVMHTLLVLVQFDDRKFTESDPAASMRDLLNKASYSSVRGIGSVYDYFHDNSNGRFWPVFDVAGPVTLSNGYAYYGQNGGWYDLWPEKAFYEACQLMDGSIDFSKYDNDKDGVVDNIFFVFAGTNESDTRDQDEIWPHQSNLGYHYKDTFDGVKLGSYACSSELSGVFVNDVWTGETVLCGIADLCHEFLHVLGLPDFYTDTVYGKASTYYDIMQYGPLNESGMVPSNMTAFEKLMLGWADEAYLETDGTYTVTPTGTNCAYLYKTVNPGEYFLFEARAAQRWDRTLGSGLVVYHIDNSQNLILGFPACETWTFGTENDYDGHRCMLILPSNPDDITADDVPFPGKLGKTTFNATTTPSALMWNGCDSGIDISGITINADGSVSFDFKSSFKPLSDSGICFIQSPDQGVEIATGTTVSFALGGCTDGIAGTIWSVDGIPCPSAQWNAASGRHNMEALNTYGDGRTESIESTIIVK